MQFLASFVAWLENGEFYSTFSTVRSVFLFIDAILIIGFVFTTMKCLEYRPSFMANPRKTRRARSLIDPEVETRWNAIVKRAGSNPPQSYSLAIIDADKLTDEALKRLGFQGEHMADRLEHLNSMNMRTLEALWRVHRLRNELVHAPDFEISDVDAREVLEVYQRFLKELGVIG
jgi:hypothetical protein